ncbi:hypothetical protein ABIB00_005150 [Bradyrhizobium sp. LB14.3]|uniref:hypothetical protein n=1 Tax=Bradyrhizobium sp. LB14.3 TaxID=3156328 RepID=UPI0033925CE6
MSKTDLAERLTQMVDAADRDGAAQQTAIARQHAADEMLQSGNFFLAENDALEAIYESALHAMVDHAVSVAAPSVAASAVTTSGLELESKFLRRFEGILGGSASGNACPPKAAQKLLSDFRARLRERLNQAVSDADNNVAGKPVRGWQGWIIRYGWNGINTLIALVALYLSWIKK